MHQPLAAGPLPHPFTSKELARLAAYKAAVQAGFYTDGCGDKAVVPGDGLAHTDAASASALASYPFTCLELARLNAYKAAVAAGLYHDGIEKGGPA